MGSLELHKVGIDKFNAVSIIVEELEGSIKMSTDDNAAVINNIKAIGIGNLMEW